MDSHEMVKERPTFRFWIVTVAILGVALYGVMFVAPGLRNALPFVFLSAACLLMHFFMHGKHGGQDVHTSGQRDTKLSATTSIVASGDRWRAPVEVREGGLRERVEIPIDGLSCASDAVRLERRLTNQHGVFEASVNPITEIAYVTFDPTVTDLLALRQRIENAGYSALERNAPTI